MRAAAYAVLGSLDRRRGGTAIAARIGDRPAGKAFSDLDDVLLRVAVVDAKRVKLHQFAGVIFVEAAFRPLLLRLLAGCFICCDTLVDLGIGRTCLTLIRSRISGVICPPLRMYAWS